MEEDLKVLEEFIKDINLPTDELLKKHINLDEIEQAIENLIKGYKELEEGLKYRVNYCGLLEKELYGNENIELTEIEKKLLEGDK